MSKESETNPLVVLISFILMNVFIVGPWLFGSEFALQAYGVYVLVFLLILVIWFVAL